jgi:hypothetical protein
MQRLIIYRAMLLKYDSSSIRVVVDLVVSALYPVEDTLDVLPLFSARGVLPLDVVTDEAAAHSVVTLADEPH